jgi:hypothetical protein
MRESWGTNDLGTTPAASSGSGWTPENWATVIGGAGQGASNVLSSMGQSVSSRKEAKENKRRILAKLMTNAINRRLKMLQSGQEYENELGDIKQKHLQDVARGFVESFGGSTKRRTR